MFQYILLGLLLVNTICAQPVRTKQNVELLGRDGKQNFPQEIINGINNVGTALQEASGGFDPISVAQNTVGSLSQGITSFLPSQSPNQQQQQEQQQVQENIKLNQLQLEQLQQQQNILQQQKIQELEQKLKPQTDAPLLAVKTPIFSAGISLPGTDLITSAASSVGSVLSPLVKQRSIIPL